MIRADESRSNSGVMPITPFLGDERFDPETKRRMDAALDMARAVVKRDWGGVYVSRIIAKHTIELTKAGERDPRVLCERALRSFLGD